MPSRFTLHILIQPADGRKGTPFDQTFHDWGEGVSVQNGPPKLGPADDPRPATATDDPAHQEVQITLHGFPKTFLLFRRVSATEGEVPWVFDPPAEVLESLASEEGSLADHAGRPLSPERPLVFCFKGTVWCLTATVHRLS